MLDGVLTFEDGWVLVEDQLRTAPERTDALFATANGYLGVRGRRREPVGCDGGGVLVLGCYETRPYAPPEQTYGLPTNAQSLLLVSDPTVVSIEVDGQDVAEVGTWSHHRRSLDLRTGCVSTAGRWRSPDGLVVDVCSRRMASLEDRHLLWTTVDVEPVGGPVDVVVTVEVRANTDARAHPDEPEALGLAWGRVLRPAARLDRGRCAALAHRTTFSGRAIACASAVDSPTEPVDRTVGDDLVRTVHLATVAPGLPLSLVQRTAFVSGAADDVGALLDRAAASISEADEWCFEDAVARQRARLDDWWDAAAVDIDGDRESEGAVRFSLFHLFQASACNPGTAAPAKGLTGQRYEGHHLWDQEVYVGHALSLLAPGMARSLLTFRTSTLDQARERASELSLPGAQYPWRTIDGTEASGFFPAGTAQHHVNAAVAWAIDHHLRCTGDGTLETEGGIEVLVETARLWASIGRMDDAGYRIASVTGPDEYTALVDDNLYTNVMAAANLEAAARRVERLATTDPSAHEELVQVLGLQEDELDSWRRIAASVHVPYDEELGVHGQDGSFLERPRWEETDVARRERLHSRHHLLTLYRHQVVKQADLVLALFLQRHRFTAAERRRDFEYYEVITVHDSSLSAPIHAVVAADLGLTDLAWHYAREAALTDLDPGVGSPENGIHVAASAGAWLALARGFGGLELDDGAICFSPRLPAALDRLRFRVRYRGSLIEVEIGRETTTYRLIRGSTVPLRHAGEDLDLDGRSATRPTLTEPPG